MKTDYKKREKLQHLVADRLMAQVRRRRWDKKGSLPPRPDPRDSSYSMASDDEEHGQDCKYNADSHASSTSISEVGLRGAAGFQDVKV